MKIFKIVNIREPTWPGILCSVFRAEQLLVHGGYSLNVETNVSIFYNPDSCFGILDFNSFTTQSTLMLLLLVTCSTLRCCFAKSRFVFIMRSMSHGDVTLRNQNISSFMNFCYKAMFKKCTLNYVSIMSAIYYYKVF